jgi:hypothetical protein
MPEDTAGATQHSFLIPLQVSNFRCRLTCLKDSGPDSMLQPANGCCSCCCAYSRCTCSSCCMRWLLLGSQQEAQQQRALQLSEDNIFSFYVISELGQAPQVPCWNFSNPILRAAMLCLHNDSLGGYLVLSLHAVGTYGGSAAQHARGLGLHRHSIQQLRRRQTCGKGHLACGRG